MRTDIIGLVVAVSVGAGCAGTGSSTSTQRGPKADNGSALTSCDALSAAVDMDELPTKTVYQEASSISEDDLPFANMLLQAELESRSDRTTRPGSETIQYLYDTYSGNQIDIVRAGTYVYVSHYPGDNEVGIVVDTTSHAVVARISDGGIAVVRGARLAEALPESTEDMVVQEVVSVVGPNDEPIAPEDMVYYERLLREEQERSEYFDAADVAAMREGSEAGELLAVRYRIPGHGDVLYVGYYPGGNPYGYYFDLEASSDVTDAPVIAIDEDGTLACLGED